MVTVTRLRLPMAALEVFARVLLLVSLAALVMRALGVLEQAMWCF